MSWNVERKGLSYFSCGTNQRKGVITLIGKDIDYKEKHVIRDKYGRFVIIYCEIQGMEFCLINLYAPNTETEQIDFYNQIFQEVTCLSCNENVNYVWGGDYNCPLSKIDVDKMHIRLKTKSINVIKQIMETYNLLDIWRVRNPSIKSYTWRSLQPLVLRLLFNFRQYTTYGYKSSNNTICRNRSFSCEFDLEFIARSATWTITLEVEYIFIR